MERKVLLQLWRPCSGMAEHCCKDRSFRLDVAWYLKVKERSGQSIMQRRLPQLLPEANVLVTNPV